MKKFVVGSAVALLVGVVSSVAQAESGDNFTLRLDGDPFNYTTGITPTPAQDYFVAPGGTFTSTASAEEVFVNAEKTTRGTIIGYRLEEKIGGVWNEGALVTEHACTYTRGEATAARLYWVWSVTHQLSFDPPAGGAVSGATSGTFYAPTDSVTLTATPSDGFEFAGWVGDVESADNPVTFTMNAPKTVIASFRRIPVVIPDHTEPVTYDWGWSNQVILADQVYSVLAFTTVGSASVTLPSEVTSLDYLVVAGGGGGGGSGKAGGGGAGGFIYKTAETVTGGGTLSITVGAGGAGGGQWSNGQKGGNSSLTGAGLNETAVGGGSGAAATQPGGAGGSGGGAGGAVDDYPAKDGGACTEGQGHVGGSFQGGSNQCGAGGGGAGGPGARAGYSTEDGVGVGGAGHSCNIVGTNVCYAAGGGGGVNTEIAPRGGSGIGGDGGANGAGRPGAANTGSGGGGSGNNYSSGGDGGSGIVIIRYVDASACAHTWVEEAKVDETCETDGSCDEHCSKCGETRHRVLPAGHVPEEMTQVAPTATTTGLEGGVKCSRCGVVLEPQTVVPKLCTGVLRAHAENRPVRVLVVGHSFSEYLAASGNNGLSFAAHKLGEQIDVLALYKGGCSIEAHWGNRNAKGFYESISSMFDSAENPFADAKQHLGDWSLTKALETYDWDVILLHNSPGGMSMDGSYTYLGDLVGLFREKAPNAEVYFNLTWSFDRYYNGGLYGVEGFGHDIAKRDEMYDRIVQYGTAACAEANVEIVPSGLAFQLYRYRKPVINDGEDIISSDHQHQDGVGFYIMTWTISRRIFGKSVTPEMFPAVGDVKFCISCANDAANSYDYAHYGQGTVDFSWDVNFKTANGADDIQSVTNRAAAVIPAWAVENERLEGWTKAGSTEVLSSATIAATPVVEPVTYTPVWAAEPPPVEPPVDPVDPPVDPTDPVDPPVDPTDPTDPPVDPPVDPTNPVIPKGNTNWITNVGFDGTDQKWGTLPSGAAFSNNRLVLDIGNDTLRYPGLIPVDVTETNLTVHTTMAFLPNETFPAVNPNAKAGFTVIVSENATNYWVLAKNASGTANEWNDTGLAADMVNDVLVRVVVTTKKGVTSAKYQFGDLNPVTRTIYAPTPAEGVMYSGAGTVSTLEGWYNTPCESGGLLLLFF